MTGTPTKVPMRSTFVKVFGVVRLNLFLGLGIRNQGSDALDLRQGTLVGL